jgi:7,8-dihydropterin-6-yl-methyl-4-(beta-D-ribofuranosyl)aminobenzene 5'-phosphate synthase
MKIVTLIENIANEPSLFAEHGLSLYIDTGEKKILFDTGQSDMFIQNAQKLGIDVSEVDVLVLSHGHFDHTGGLYSFLEMNKKARVYAKKEIFTSKYKDKTHFIGTVKNESALSDRMIFVKTITEVAPDVFILPNIELHHDIDTNFTHLYTKEGNSYFPDKFDDELFLVIQKNKQINLITACSHRGITNICTTASNYFKLPVNLILGGFHMKYCGVEQYRHIIQYLGTIQPKLIGICHCTGIERFSEMIREFNSKVFYNFTGNEINIK